MLLNPRRWPFWVAVVVLFLAAAAGVTAWLLRPTYVDIDPVPWIERSISWPVVVVERSPERMGILLLADESRPIRVNGHELGVCSLQNPVIYGVEHLPVEFLGECTEVLAWEWLTREVYGRNAQLNERWCPMVLLEINNEQAIAALGAGRLLRRRLPIQQENPWAHGTGWNWCRCRYEGNMPIELLDCNPVPRMLEPHGLHGAAPEDVVCSELEVDSRFPYYLLTTNDHPIGWVISAMMGTAEPYLKNAQGWLIISNPLLHGDGNGSYCLQSDE